jgi:hypothetical protein
VQRTASNGRAPLRCATASRKERPTELDFFGHPAFSGHISAMLDSTGVVIDNSPFNHLKFYGTTIQQDPKT